MSVSTILKKKIGDSELSNSLVARVYRRKILQIAIVGQRKKWNPPLSCVILYGFFCFFFFHVFRLCMTFFPSFIYTWSFENRVSKKNQLIVLLGNLKQ